MAFSEKRRFVAGAVCPRCSAMDKVVVYNQEGKDFRECVACGFKDEMRFTPQVRELDTRVNQDADVAASEVSAIKIIDPSAKGE